MVYIDDLHPIAQYRFMHNLTQVEMSDMLGFERSILAKIESNSYNPTDEQKVKVRRITGIIL